MIFLFPISMAKSYLLQIHCPWHHMLHLEQTALPFNMILNLMWLQWQPLSLPVVTDYSNIELLKRQTLFALHYLSIVKRAGLKAKKNFQAPWVPIRITELHSQLLTTFYYTVHFSYCSTRILSAGNLENPSRPPGNSAL